MYRVISIGGGHRTEDKIDSYPKAEKLAWKLIKNKKVHTVEIWMGNLFHASVRKEGHI
jgi:hypothetical protein